MRYDDWQEEMIEDTSQYIMLCKGRQIGGTSTFAEKAVKWMKERKSKILVGSITEEQAKLVILMVKDILFKKDDLLEIKFKYKVSKAVDVPEVLELLKEDKEGFFKVVSATQKSLKDFVKSNTKYTELLNCIKITGTEVSGVVLK